MCKTDKIRDLDSLEDGELLIIALEKVLEAFKRAKRDLDSLYGQKFSDRAYYALKSRVEDAERKFEAMREILIDEGCIDRCKVPGKCVSDNNGEVKCKLRKILEK